MDELDHIDWDNLFVDLPLSEDGFLNLIDEATTTTTTPTVESWIEELLMKDDDEDHNNNNQALGDDFLWSDLLVDSPLEDRQPSTERESSNDKSGDDVLDLDDDPLSKKRKRQLRNRDAALRSRERKKMYVKDLEMKSRYMEAECRRLGRLLQCCYAENQMLRISLGSAYSVSLAKPESAVLLLESLLLVSLVWLMVNICLLPLPKLPLLNQDAVPHGSVERKERESVAPKGKGTKVTKQWLTLSFMRSKRCRAARIKMRPVLIVMCYATETPLSADPLLPIFMVVLLVKVGSQLLHRM